MIKSGKIACCAEDGSASVHIVSGSRGIAKPICGPWWADRTRFHRVDADRPTCRICLRVLGDLADSPRIRLSMSLAHSVKPVVHVAHITGHGEQVPRCGGAGVATKRYDVTTDVVTCKVCLGFTRGPK